MIGWILSSDWLDSRDDRWTLYDESFEDVAWLTYFYSMAVMRESFPFDRESLLLNFEIVQMQV